MKRVFGLLHKIEGSETAVLVRGEAGTGKGLLAQAIHTRSRRGKGRFVAVNLGHDRRARPRARALRPGARRVQRRRRRP